MEGWWTDSHSLCNRFIRQFVPQDDLDHYEITHENPDYTIIFGRTDWSKLQTRPENTFYFSQEPSWSPNQPKDIIHNFCDKIFVSEKRLYPDSDKYIETLLPMFYGGRGDLDHRIEWDWSRNFFEHDFSQYKSQIVSSVVTNSWNSHLNYLSDKELCRIIYEDRMNVVSNLCSTFPEFKLWGSFREPNGVNIMGTAWNKLEALKQFRFSLCFENTIQKNYISEKFWDCIITDTVPIYFGCSNIHEYISEDNFINMTSHIDDIDSINDKLSFIIKNSVELYNDYLPKIKELKHQFTKDKRFNLWERIKSEIN